ncbi:MAG: NADH-quinone oxidoreductase subunit C [Acidimicrobiia bacterium]|nr:NADH-quinone oxidoreductase subunit C [Acidimicrobiia bacterium]
MTAADLIQAVRGRFPDAVIGSHDYRGDATVIIHSPPLLEVARTLKQDPAFRMNFLMDLTAVDYSAFGKKPDRAFFASSGVPVRPPPQIPDPEPWPGPPSPARFALVYHFFSSLRKHRIRMEVPVEEQEAELDSLTSLWPGADWLEREVWDMFGIRFRGHGNLKRILMYEEFSGHPLRKDYPVNKRQPLLGPVN